MKVVVDNSNPGRLRVTIPNPSALSTLRAVFIDMQNVDWLADAPSESFGYEMVYGDGPNGREEDVWYGRVWWEAPNKGLDVCIRRGRDLQADESLRSTASHLSCGRFRT